MNAILVVLGLILTVVIAVGVPTLLLMYGFTLPWLKALAVAFALSLATGSGSK